MEKRVKIARIIILCATVILSAVSCCFLPDSVAIQWNASGASNYAPKYLAVLIPVVLCLLMLQTWRARRETQAPAADYVWVAASCLGIVVDILMLILN